MALRFRARNELVGTSATGIAAADEVVEALGAGRKPPVTVTLGGHTCRSTVGSRGGRFMLPLSAEKRTAAGVGAGDEVDVEVELDTEPRVMEVPADLAEALDAEPAARRAFDKLSYSHQQRWVLSVQEAKAAETRQRRIDKAVTTLRDAG